MKKILSLILCLESFAASAASYVTITNTFTNRTVVGDSFTAGGVTVRFTNAPLNAQFWLVTNTAAASATNVQRFLGRTQPALYARLATATNLVVSGNDLQFSISGGFGFVTTNSSLATNQTVVTIPWNVLTPANQTNQADALILGIGNYGWTNTFPANSQALTNFVGKTNIATLYGKTLASPVVLTPTNWGGTFSNVSVLQITNIDAQAIKADGGSFSNGFVLAAQGISGTIVAVSNGVIRHASVTNAPWVNATNANVTTARIDTLTVWTAATITNLSAPGTGNNSQRIGSGSTAAGGNAITVGVSANASQDGSIALGAFSSAGGEFALAAGNQAVAVGDSSVAVGASAGASNSLSSAFGFQATSTNDSSTAIGNNALTTMDSQIRLGTAAETVSVPGVLSVENGITNHVTTGTNRVNARVDYARRTVSSLVNGANSGIVLGSNVVVNLSGGSTIMALCGFQAAVDGTFHILRISGGVTNVVVHAANSTDFATDATAANRIYTGTGTNLYFTNSYFNLPVVYNSALPGWEVIGLLR